MVAPDLLVNKELPFLVFLRTDFSIVAICINENLIRTYISINTFIKRLKIDQTENAENNFKILVFLIVIFRGK